MFHSYIKTALRSIRKNKVNFAFKLGGLALALFSFLIIALYVTYQLSFDRFHEGCETIYRVNAFRYEDGSLQTYATVPNALGPALRAEFPQIKTYTRLGISGRALIKYNDKIFRPNGFVPADSNVFDVFKFNFIYGDNSALDQPYSIVLTESLAKLIFGDESPLNKPLSFEEYSGRILYVTGVIEDIPSNTHLDLMALVSNNALNDTEEPPNNPWDIDVADHLYVRLKDNASFSDFTQKVAPLLQKHLAKEEDGSEKKFSVFLQPLSEIYLSPRVKMEFTRKGNALYIYIFSLLGVFLLIIAAINYVNLSIADFTSRMKELGVRKILGARKRQIVFQLSLEALFYCLAGLLLSLAVLYFIFPDVARLLDRNLQFSMLLNTNVMLLVAATILLLWLLSVLYPSIVLSVTSTVNSLKGPRKQTGKIQWASKLLVIQFVVSIICVCISVMVGRQVHFINETDLGYDRHHIVALLMPDRYPLEKAPALKAALQNLSGVESVSFSYYIIAGSSYWKDWYKVELEGEMKQMLLNEVFIDHDFLTTMGIKLVEGRNFDINNPSDTLTAFIVNEAAVEQFGWADPIGKKISYGFGDENQEGSVIGVTNDFNVLSLHEKIEPLIMRLPFDSWPGYWLNVKIQGPMDETLAAIKSAYEKVLPGFPADYRFVEDVYNNQYRNETKAYNTLQAGTWVIVLISALGIFSLSVYLSIRRMKEFGIRKVLGATAGQITFIHVSYFLRLVLLSNVIALPLAYWLVEKWLSVFAYRTDANGSVFLAVMAASLLVVALSAGYTSWKAGRMNPVDVIKLD